MAATSPFDRNSITKTPALGQLVTTDEKRDAVHIAVIPMIARNKLMPGQHVGIEDGTTDTCTELTDMPIGVVDPYLQGPVTRGERFWLFLYPGQVTTLRHEWTHPAFPEPVDVGEIAIERQKAKAEEWLRAYAKKHNSYDDEPTGFNRLIEGLRESALYFHGRRSVYSISGIEDADELRENAEVYLGMRINYDDFTVRCSC